MTDILVDTGAICIKVRRYIQKHIQVYGYCSVEDVAHLNGVRSVQVSEIGWPLRRVGWFKIPEITFQKDSEEDFWKIQLDDPVLLNNNRPFFRPFFVKSPGGTWEPIDESIEPLVDTYSYVGRRNGKTYLDSIACDRFRGGKIYDVKTIHKEDMVDAMRYSDWLTQEIGNAFKNVEKETFRKHFEYPLTPKSIEQSADHKTVCVLWQDGSKTIVKLSDNDKDDIDTAFAYALAKKIFGTNTHLKKVVRQKLNEHKPKDKVKTPGGTLEPINEGVEPPIDTLPYVSPKIVDVEETPYGTVQHHSDGDYCIISNQTQSGLSNHFNKEDN